MILIENTFMTSQLHIYLFEIIMAHDNGRVYKITQNAIPERRGCVVRKTLTS